MCNLIKTIKECEKEVKNFKPSTDTEIESFNLKKDEEYEIKVIDTCPFTYISDIYQTKAYVEDEMILQGSKYKLYFSYDDAYGRESYSFLESVKILKKIK